MNVAALPSSGQPAERRAGPASTRRPPPPPRAAPRRPLNTWPRSAHRRSPLPPPATCTPMEEQGTSFLGWTNQWFSDFTMHWDASGSWFKPTIAASHTQGQEFAFLTSVGGLLPVLVLGPHLPNKGLSLFILSWGFWRRPLNISCTWQALRTRSNHDQVCSLVGLSVTEEMDSF